jgi:hypothetical protein
MPVGRVPNAAGFVSPTFWVLPPVNATRSILLPRSIAQPVGPQDAINQ